MGVGAPLTVIPYDEWRTKEVKAEVAEARARGEIPLKPAEYEQVQRMAEQIAAHQLAMSLLDGARHEVSAFRVDEQTGVWLRCRWDSIKADGIADYKTAVSADPAEFARQAVKLGYHQQDAWYCDMARAHGVTDGPFRFIVQEKAAPYLVSVIELDEDTERLGRRMNRQAIDTYANCRATDQWPGYPPVVNIVSAPPWAFETPDTLDPDTEQELLDLLEGPQS
nr:PD-(D/E)XK nuclease-like domain-containing protein [Brooklawnia cerclae]